MTEPHRKASIPKLSAMPGFEQAIADMNKALRAVRPSRGLEAMLAAEERRARALHLAALPRPLRWLVDHPKLLRAYYRLRPSKRPTLAFWPR